MTADIVERLRADPKIGGTVVEKFRAMLEQRHEAADEIERLRNDYFILKQDYDALREEWNELVQVAREGRRALEPKSPTMQEISDEIEASEREFRPMRAREPKP